MQNVHILSILLQFFSVSLWLLSPNAELYIFSFSRITVLKALAIEIIFNGYSQNWFLLIKDISYFVSQWVGSYVFLLFLTICLLLSTFRTHLRAQNIIYICMNYYIYPFSHITNLCYTFSAFVGKVLVILFWESHRFISV